MTEPQRLERLGTNFTWCEDFVIGCRYPRSMIGGKPCTESAQYWVERHVVNGCRHPSLDDGCASGFVCADHLDALSDEAERTVRRNNPPKWMFWRRETGWCRSCGTQRLQVQTDVLQTVIGLSR